jgi:hypothetical protein
MRAGETSPDRCCAESTKLPASIPPLCNIHLAKSRHDYTKLQQPVKVDYCSRHLAVSWK